MWMSSRSMSSSGMSAAESVMTAKRRPASWLLVCCRRMSSAFSALTCPYWRARSNTRSGSSTWICILALRLVPASTSESPRSASASRSLRRSISVPVTTHSVQNRYPDSSEVPAVTTGASMLSNDRSGSATSFPVTRYSAIPSMRSTKPLAPASTTPALRSTSSCSCVSASACFDCWSAFPSSSAKPPSASCAAPLATLAAKAAVTDSMVPSRGFDIASCA